jgi:hypothetical protein
MWCRPAVFHGCGILHNIRTATFNILGFARVDIPPFVCRRKSGVLENHWPGGASLLLSKPNYAKRLPFATTATLATEPKV